MPSGGLSRLVGSFLHVFSHLNPTQYDLWPTADCIFQWRQDSLSRTWALRRQKKNDCVFPEKCANVTTKTDSVCVSLRERKLVDCLDVAVWLIVLRHLWLQSKKPFSDTRPSRDKSLCSINHDFSFTCKAFTRRMRFIVQRKIEQCFYTECEYFFWGGVMLTTSAAMADKVIICVSQRPVITSHQSVGLVRVVVAPLSHMRLQVFLVANASCGFTSEHFAFLCQFPECVWVSRWKKYWPTKTSSLQLHCNYLFGQSQKTNKAKEVMVDPNCEKISWNNLIENSFEWLFTEPNFCLKNLNQTWTSSPWRNLNVHSFRTNGNPVKTMSRDGGKPILAALESNS